MYSFSLKGSRELLAFVGRERNDGIVETRDGDAAVFIAQLCEHLRESHRWIFERAAVNAGMQIARGPVHDDFEGNDPAQSVRERGMLWTRDAVVGDDNGVALQFGAVRLEEFAEMFAADLLLAFDDEGQVAG